MVTSSGAIGYGIFPEVLWHKQEKEDIMANVGIKVGYGEILKEAVIKGTYKTVSDREHAEIIELYANTSMSMTQISQQLKRSSRTIAVHIASHNHHVKKSGFCGPCKRVHSPHAQADVTHGF